MKTQATEMGTNFYHATHACSCGRPCEPIHVGKKSSGWAFTLRIYDGKYEEGPASVEEWRERLTSGGVLRDEYGDPADVTAILEALPECRTATDRFS